MRFTANDGMRSCFCVDLIVLLVENLLYRENLLVREKNRKMSILTASAQQFLASVFPLLFHGIRKDMGFIFLVSFEFKLVLDNPLH